MKKTLLLLFTLLIGVSGAWADSKISKAVAGTYLFDSNNPVLTVNEGGTATITNSEGVIVIHHDNLSTVGKGANNYDRTYAAVVLRVDMPTTALESFSKFISLKPSNDFTGSIGLGVTTDGKLKGTWGGSEWNGGNGGVVTSSAVTGEHTIVMLCNDGGTTIYVDGTGTSVNNSGLKSSTKWTDLRIESAYASCVKSVYVFSGDQASYISAFFSELSNVVTVANSETKRVSENSTATRFFVASGGTLTANAAYDMDKIEGAGEVTVDADLTISGNIATIATGKLTINEGKTLTLGGGDSQTNSIASFTSIELAGTFKLNNSTATLNGVTVPTSKTGKIFAYDMGSTSDGFKLAGTTTLTGNLVVCSKYNFQMKVDALAGSGDCLICGTTGGSFDASGTSSNEAATINITSASSYTGDVTVNNSKATVNVSGSLVASTWTKTNGTLKYTGNNLSGTTLDGVVLASTTARVTTGGTVNIKNLAGCNLPNPSGNYGYAFIGSGIINFYGTCDLTKQADETDALSSNLGYGSSATIVVKENATLKAGVLFNTRQGDNNASITVESGGTLTTIGWTHDDGVLCAKNLVNNGTINISTGRFTSGYGISTIHNTLSGSGTLNIAEGSNFNVASIPSGSTLTGAGVVVLTSFPTSSAPTLSSWTGTIEFPDGGSNGTNLEAIFNAWGNTNSTIKLNNVNGGYLGSGGTVNPSLNILSGKTLTLNNGFSGSNSTITRVTGEGILDRQGWSNSNNHNLYITTLTDFTGTLKGTGHPIIVQKLVLPSAPYVNTRLIKTTGDVTLEKLYINLEETTAYSWETTTVETVEGIYISAINQVQLNRETAIALVTPYYNGNHVGAGLGKYTISLGETSYANMKDFGDAVTAWATIGDCVEPTIAINMPTNGFYRFTSQNNLAQTGNVGKYLHNYLTDGAIALNSTEDKTTIFYVDCTNNTLLSYDNGLYLNNYNVQPAVGSSSTWTIEEGSERGKYALKWADGWYASDWNTTDKITYGQKDANALWAIEPVESLPITLNDGGDGYYYATLCLPRSVTVSEGTSAYTLSISGSMAVPSDPIDGAIPAGTPVLLKGSSNSATLTITGDSYASSPLTSTALTGTYAAIDVTSTKGSDYYLGRYRASESDPWEVGFYHWNQNTLSGFRAYLTAATVNGSGVKGFVINWDNETKITETTEKTEATESLFDLSGRRVSKAQKGLYIQNGKKLLVK